MVPWETDKDMGSVIK